MFKQEGTLISLKGKVAIVTGASSGIGEEVSRTLSKSGCSVALIDIDESRGRVIEDEIKKSNEKVKFYRCDISSSKMCMDSIEKISSEIGKIDIVVNAAGTIIRKGVAELNEQEWDRVIDIDLKGVFLVSHYAIPNMNDGGSIINIGSGWGLKGGAKAIAYCAAKGGVVNMTRAMAIDLGPRNIRVNCIDPGDVETPMLRGEALQLNEEIGKFMIEAADRPIRRVGKPLDIAYAVLYLASDLSTWTTGANIVVDGGGLA